MRVRVCASVCLSVYPLCQEAAPVHTLQTPPCVPHVNTNIVHFNNLSLSTRTCCLAGAQHASVWRVARAGGQTVGHPEGRRKSRSSLNRHSFQEERGRHTHTNRARELKVRVEGKRGRPGRNSCRLWTSITCSLSEIGEGTFC